MDIGPMRRSRHPENGLERASPPVGNPEGSFCPLDSLPFSVDTSRWPPAGAVDWSEAVQVPSSSSVSRVRSAGVGA